MRSLARENMYKLAFSFEFTREFAEHSLQEFCEDVTLEESDIAYLKNFYYLYFQNYDTLLQKLKDNLVEKNFERIYKSDVVVLLCAICEIDFVKTPKKVAINEAVNIAKKYGAGDSGRFANGILGTIYGDINGENN